MITGGLICLLTVTVGVFDVISCVEPPVPLAQSQPIQQGECIKYLLPGKGDYKLERKRYPTQRPDFYVANVDLKERTSFYKCTPDNEKYGVDLDGKTWWVDKGCEGIFEVRECLDEASKLKSGDWKDTVYAEFLKLHDKPVAINNMHEWRILGTENRFDHPSLSRSSRQN